MKTMNQIALAASALLLMSAAAQADDYTTTTRTVHHEDHGGGAYIGVPGVVGVHVGSDRGGCATRSKTVTNQDTGESHTRTETNC
jgi:hypothetical protein